MCASSFRPSHPFFSIPTDFSLHDLLSQSFYLYLLDDTVICLLLSTYLLPLSASVSALMQVECVCVHHCVIYEEERRLPDTDTIPTTSQRDYLPTWRFTNIFTTIIEECSHSLLGIFRLCSHSLLGIFQLISWDVPTLCWEYSNTLSRMFPLSAGNSPTH